VGARGVEPGGQPQPTRVFVSYAHDVKAQVLKLCELLRRNGIDARFDQDNDVPHDEWHPWFLRQIDDANYVIVVASPAYKRVGDGLDTSSDHRGVRWEAPLLLEKTYEDRSWMRRLLPVVLPGSSPDELPVFLLPNTGTHYRVTEFTVDGSRDLIGVLTGQHPERTPIGRVPYLPPRPYPGHRAGSGPDVAMWTAMERLAEDIGMQWLREEERSGVLGRAMPVRWAVTANAEESPAEVTRQSLDVDEQRLVGRFDGIADLFAGQLTQRRLVILGGTGTGKTVLATRLVRDLVRGRLPDQPVPVLLSVGTWDPGEQRLTEWMAGRLVQDYPYLRSHLRAGSRRRTTLANALVDSKRILPVLDGLDTIAPDMRGEAIAAINSLGPDLPLVVTSQVEPYLQAIRAAEPLSNAAVVELLPFTLPEVRAYLAPDDGGERWRRVFATLDDDPDHPLAQALRTPLMVWLARTKYSDAAEDPGELCDRARFPDREAVEYHLIDGLVPAVYPLRPTPAQRRDTDKRWNRSDVRPWLTFLARHPTSPGNHDIAWWQLYRAVPHLRQIQRFLGMFLYGLLFGLPFGGIGVGVVLGLGFGLLGSSSRVARQLGASTKDGPYRMQLTSRGLRATFRQVLIGMSSVLVPFAAGWILLEVSGGNLGFTIVGGLLYLLSIGALLRIGIRRKRLDVTRQLVVADDPTRAVSPDSTLRADRTSTLVPAVGLALIGAMASGLFRHPYGILFGLALAVGWTSVGAWTRYTAARTVLALRGHLPWRLLDFLRDAADRGVLRQAGAVYEFRHPRVRDGLAADGSAHPESGR
jgi:hypothetical protein